MDSNQDAQDVVPLPLSEISFRAQWAALAIRESLGSIQRDAPAVRTEKADAAHLIPIEDSWFIGPDKNQTFHVGIVGAGVAGLFTAMIFDHLRDRFKLNVDYEILEANNEKRLGGRLFSYYFENVDGEHPVGPHDYFDIGAMRFPKIPTMNRTFELFNELGVEKSPDGQRPQKGNLVDYYLNGRNQPALYNGIRIDKKEEITARNFRIPDLPKDIIDRHPDDVISETIRDFRFELDNYGAEKFWEKLKKEADAYSVRQYLTWKGFDYNTIEFLETLNYGNRWYDQALSEMILESMNFDPKAPWFCVEGGSQEIAHRMRGKLVRQEALKFGKKVTAMSYVGGCDGPFEQIDVTVKGERGPRTYDAVFNSVPLGAMQHMQLEGLNLNWGTKSAIRSLGYGASCKVGVRFKSLWWIRELGIDQGGQGKTDLPIRCCVYPSYNRCDPVDKPGVLLVSYTWSQEAERIGALISRNSPQEEDELKAVLFHDLARLHAKTTDEDDYQRLHEIISGEYLTHYAYNWYEDPHTVGAFAYFGPAQFKNMYQWITRNDGKHIIIGEVASAHHAWVVGALESAVRGVYQFLCRHSKFNKAADCAARAYCTNDIKGPYGPLPAEFDRTEDILLPPDCPNVKAQKSPSPHGELARMQVLFEIERLKQGGDRIDSKAIKEVDHLVI